MTHHLIISSPLFFSGTKNDVSNETDPKTLFRVFVGYEDPTQFIYVGIISETITKDPY